MKLVNTFKTYLLITIGIVFLQKANAQLKVGNNSTTLNSSAILEVEATNKGFLPPRVALTGSNDVTTIPSPATGLIVYNTANAGTGDNVVVANSLYLFNGTKWSKMSDQSNTSASNIYLFSGTVGVGGNYTSTSILFPNYTTMRYANEVDPSNSFNPAAGVYSVKESGFYFFSTSVQFDNSAGTVASFSSVGLRIILNGTDVLAQVFTRPNNTIASAATSTIVYLNVGDQVSVAITGQATGTYYSYSAPVFNGYKISN